MNALKIILISGLLPVLAHGADTTAQRDGQHDFDWEIGTWKTQLKRLQRPLTGSTAWVEYEGTTVVRKVWDGRANLVELDVKGSAGEIEALSLRLYNPGRSIFVKFVIQCESSDVCRFEQSFSGDGGQTWEANWIATDTRIK
jgi:hypothetical protein